jgi:hypothetical protein
MTLQEIKAIARSNGMRIRNMKKENIIRTLQQIEGNASCFATDEVRECGQENCLWRHDCLLYELLQN